MNRRLARELALQTLYSVEIGRNEPAQALADVSEGANLGEDRAFVRDLVLGTIESSEECDAVIVPLLQGWTIERLPTLDRLLLRMGVYELRHCRETPPAVVINEAVELAKKFSTEDSGSFVNGVLDRASKVA